jgi:bacteriorhodopsin
MDFTLSVGQFELVYNVFSLTLATMFGAGIFFFAARTQVAPAYRPALIISGVVVFIAGYHYFRIFESWASAYILQGTSYVPSGIPFNEAYRYADWLITVPLLLIELVAVLGLSKALSANLTLKLSIAAVAMLVLGYPGEISDHAGTRWLFWGLSMIPFIYILSVLFGQLTKAVDGESGEVKSRLAAARNLIVLSWWVYPVAFILPMIGLSGATAQVGVQVGYSIADLTAKALYGVFIYRIARAKSEAEGFNLSAAASTT